MTVILSFLGGLAVYAVIRLLITGFYVVRPDQRAVLTSFGRAERLAPEGTEAATDPSLSEDERERYRYPSVRVIGPGGPYFKWPWQQVHKVSVATQAADIVWDPTKQQSTIEAVTKDNLTTGVNGQIRYRVSENNLYAYLFGVESPLEHVMGYFISVLRERIANFVDPKGQSLVAGAMKSKESDGEGGAIDLSEGVSINDLRKNLPMLNQYMEEQCRSTGAATASNSTPPHHRDRPAPRGRSRPLRHQQHPQPGRRRHQHRAAPTPSSRSP